ncbi:hypothetical protein BGZ96_005671 [Linnemannia gamsii]|uniref:Uncharacterized protein n=1 Tax=Linnemannia gamsii TaxID=64522 RepID=A0ABQ7K4W2_9FUNG|nr:hypothetical protein BGZ96_005671 [Linnemannia gamsii]
MCPAMLEHATDTKQHTCVNITSTWFPLPPSINQIITLDDSPFGLQKDEGAHPVLFIIAAAFGIAGLAILADPQAISGVTLVKVPEEFSSAHWLPSTNSLDYATPLPSPQIATFARDLNTGSPQLHSQTNINQESSAVIKTDTRHFLNDSQEPTTTAITTAMDCTRRLLNDTHMLGQTEELSMLAGERGVIARSMTVSHTIDSEGSELQKSRSLLVRGSKALPALLQSPKAPKSVRKGRAAHLRLNVPSPTYIASELLPGSTTPTISSAPLQPHFTSAPTSPSTPVSYYSSTSGSSNSLPGSPFSSGGVLCSRRVSLTSPSQGGGGYSNSPTDQRLPAGFASSPVTKAAGRFD